MRLLDATAVARALTPTSLLPALERLFTAGCTSPPRHHHEIPVPDGVPATLLLMPSWQAGGYLGVKLATVYPSNAARGLPAVSAAYLLMDATTGVALAMIDGEELTARRTAATSALAARYLARPDARSLLVAGTGRIALELARWHAATRPNLGDVAVWGRTPAHVQNAVRTLLAQGVVARSVNDLDAAVAEADLVCAATLSTRPLILGRHVRPGAHVDLVGGYSRQMREADDALIAKARVYVDTPGALTEPGDIVVPVEAGLLDPATVTDLAALCSGRDPGRRRDDEITVFKSVGAAIEDLAAAIVVYEAA